MEPGKKLQSRREKLGLTLRQVEELSLRISTRRKNTHFVIPYARLYEMEHKGAIPSIYRLYSLSAIYQVDVRELLSWYGIDLSGIAADFSPEEIPLSHLASALDFAGDIRVPIRSSLPFDRDQTALLEPFIAEWGAVPLAFLRQFERSNLAYGYIGMEDGMMYPLAPPGSFVQIDTSRNVARERNWRNEHERPIYFVETPAGFKCCWCTVAGDTMVLQPHLLSVETQQVWRRSEARIVGEVVAIAMRLRRKP